jgi:hypothetical protein
MVANFRTEAITVYPALDLVQRKLFLGFVDNIVRSDLVQSNFGVSFAVWAQVQVQVLGQKSMTELKKEAPVPQPQIDTIVKALEGAIAPPVIFSRSPGHAGWHQCCPQSVHHEPGREDFIDLGFPRE